LDKVAARRESHALEIALRSENHRPDELLWPLLGSMIDLARAYKNPQVCQLQADLSYIYVTYTWAGVNCPAEKT
jgi:hypothetical protein